MQKINLNIYIGFFLYGFDLVIFLQEQKSEDSRGDYFGKREISDEKIIVFLPLLLDLFQVCHVPTCGEACDKDNMHFHFSGAMVTVTVTCNRGHDFRWQSSPSVGSGKKQVAAINVLLGTYGYLCGINVKKVFLGN